MSNKPFKVLIEIEAPDAETQEEAKQHAAEELVDLLTKRESWGDFFALAQALERKFHRQVYVVEVLSEEELPSMSLEELGYEISEGHCSGKFVETFHQEVGGPCMAKLLRGQGSDTEFFQLDENGNDLDDE